MGPVFPPREAMRAESEHQAHLKGARPHPVEIHCQGCQEHAFSFNQRLLLPPSEKMEDSQSLSHPPPTKEL